MDPREIGISDTLRQIGNARGDIARTDTKAGLLAAVVIPVGGILLATPTLNGQHEFVAVLTWSAIAAFLASIAYVGSVVWPRLDGDSGYIPMATMSSTEITDWARRHSEDPEARQDAASRELELVSKIALTKFSRLRISILCSGLGAMFALAAVSASTFST